MTTNGKKYLVQQYGGIWVLGKRNYTKLGKLAAAGNEYDLDVLGVQLGDIDMNPLDIEEEAE